MFVVEKRITSPLLVRLQSSSLQLIASSVLEHTLYRTIGVESVLNFLFLLEKVQVMVAIH